jgi:hypothetical protein
MDGQLVDARIPDVIGGKHLTVALGGRLAEAETDEHQ